MKTKVQNKLRNMEKGLMVFKQKAINALQDFLRDESGMGTVEVILIIVEKPNAKHRYVLCGK